MNMFMDKINWDDAKSYSPHLYFAGIFNTNSNFEKWAMDHHMDQHWWAKSMWESDVTKKKKDFNCNSGDNTFIRMTNYPQAPTSESRINFLWGYIDSSMQCATLGNYFKKHRAQENLQRKPQAWYGLIKLTNKNKNVLEKSIYSNRYLTSDRYPTAHINLFYKISLYYRFFSFVIMRTTVLSNLQREAKIVCGITRNIYYKRQNKQNNQELS